MLSTPESDILQDYTGTVDEMLRAVYDVLELLRYLRLEQDVISVGNSLIVDSREASLKSEDRKHKELCFVKHLIDPKYHQHDTQVLLIDFNHAEHVTARIEAKRAHNQRVGTPGFIPRAVEHGGHLPGLEEHLFIAHIPDAPHSYRWKHPSRWADFPVPSNASFEFWDPKNPPDSDNHPWRRELDHDSEAVFWVFLYWAMGAQPVSSEDKEKLKGGCWANFVGGWDDRYSLLLGAASRQFVHSSLQSSLPLIRDLAHILTVDRSWLRHDDCRKHPAYVGEAFQRLILHFLIRNKDEAFMKLEIDVNKRRTPEEVPDYLIFSIL